MLGMQRQGRRAQDSVAWLPGTQHKGQHAGTHREGGAPHASAARGPRRSHPPCACARPPPRPPARLPALALRSRQHHTELVQAHTASPAACLGAALHPSLGVNVALGRVPLPGVHASARWRMGVPTPLVRVLVLALSPPCSPGPPSPRPRQTRFHVPLPLLSTAGLPLPLPLPQGLRQSAGPRVALEMLLPLSSLALRLALRGIAVSKGSATGPGRGSLPPGLYWGLASCGERQPRGKFAPCLPRVSRPCAPAAPGAAAQATARVAAPSAVTLHSSAVESPPGCHCVLSALPLPCCYCQHPCARSPLWPLLLSPLLKWSPALSAPLHLSVGRLLLMLLLLLLLQLLVTVPALMPAVTVPALMPAGASASAAVVPGAAIAPVAALVAASRPWGLAALAVASAIGEPRAVLGECTPSSACREAYPGCWEAFPGCWEGKGRRGQGVGRPWRPPQRADARCSRTRGPRKERGPSRRSLARRRSSGAAAPPAPCPTAGVRGRSRRSGRRAYGGGSPRPGADPGPTMAAQEGRPRVKAPQAPHLRLENQPGRAPREGGWKRHHVPPWRPKTLSRRATLLGAGIARRRDRSAPQEITRGRGCGI